ncbi:MAG TPA: fatty acyl-AMP ligase [Pyrinomonadaceae bacterium]|nr:fatty acyl-AMP ligase [Pyrinomonadaceae bacterium]
MNTIVDLLEHRAATRPDQAAYRFSPEGMLGPHSEQDEGELTYAQVLERARAVAGLLLKLDPLPRQAVLVYPTGLDFVGALFGCLIAGVAAVPAMPPLSRPERAIPRLKAITEDAQATVGLSTRALIDLMSPLWAPRHGWLATNEIDSSGSLSLPARPSAADLAVIQYTSGSTSLPKGVMVRHSEALAQVQRVHRSIPDADDSWVFVNWMPMFHDGGLVGGILLPLELGITSVLMAPEAFTTNPYRWLKLISEQPATFSGSPNFGYELCMRKVTEKQRKSLDLSSWVLAINSGEPVRWSTLASFAETFRESGFNPGAFVPAYGLAEATLLVTMRRRNLPKDDLPIAMRVMAGDLETGRIVAAGPAEEAAESSRSTVIVGCGEPVDAQQVVIVDPVTRTRTPPDTVGEIWLAGPSVTGGYWTGSGDERFGFTLEGSAEQYLRTGDLGFMSGGVLYPTGRIKDMIIVRGRNLYPQDIERVVELAHPRLRRGCGAAFGIMVDGTEDAAVIFEVDETSPLDDRESAEVFAAMRQAVADECDVMPVGLGLIKRRTLPKTSSGKIQRSTCKAKFLDGTLELVAAWRHPRFQANKPTEVMVP